MNRLSLTLIFLFFILLLGLVYVLLNQRRSRGESSPGGSSGHVRVLHPPLVKELVLCCLCLKNQSRIEPTIASPNTTTSFSVTVNPVSIKPPQSPAVEEDANDDELEMEKLRHESMLLYTINEEDEEEEEEEEEEEKGLEDVVVESKIDVQEEEELTSFSSACSSPLYSTPASSPPHLNSQTCFHPMVGKL